MKSAILYSSLRNFGNQQEVKAPDGTPIFIRVEVAATDVEGALHSAKPMPGETVLNTIPLSQQP